MDGIKQWIEAEGSGHFFFIAFPVVLVCLLIWFKGRRVRFLIPSLLISIVIINPWFYRAWDKFGLYAYWRILWIIPVIPVVAGLVPSLTERIKKPWMKSIVAAAGVGMVVVGGTFLYNGAGGSFVEAANASKLPDYVVQIADRLLELDDHPRVIAQDPIGVYIRQYSGSIDSAFGRDLNGYIWPQGANWKLKSSLDAGDWNIVNQTMLDDGYDYLVASAADSPLRLVSNAGGYGIYQSTGSPTVIKERNNLGQVVTATFVNGQGQPENRDGYATTKFTYDRNGNVSDEIRITERFDEQIITSGNDYMTSGVRAAYHNMHLVYEAYYDNNGELEVQPAGHVAIEQEWDDEGNLLSRTYLGPDGLPMNRIDGYSKVTWELDEGKKRSLSFYDTEGKRIIKNGVNLIQDIGYDSEGWSVWMTPNYNANNYCIRIGCFNLGKKSIGDRYICKVTIEFDSVSAIEGQEFRIKAQGAQDGGFSTDNVWSPSLINLRELPENGVSTYTSTTVISKEMMDIRIFDVEFRCDYWKTGSFRIRDLVIEKIDDFAE